MLLCPLCACAKSQRRDGGELNVAWCCYGSVDGEQMGRQLTFIRSAPSMFETAMCVTVPRPNTEDAHVTT